MVARRSAEAERAGEHGDSGTPACPIPARGTSRAGAREGGGCPTARQGAPWPRGGPAGIAPAGGGGGEGRAPAGGGVGSRGGLPRPRSDPAVALISPRGRWPRQRRAPATPRSPSQRTDLSSLVPGQTFAHELSAGKDSTLAPGSPRPQGCGRFPGPSHILPLPGDGGEVGYQWWSRDLRAPTPPKAAHYEPPAICPAPVLACIRGSRRARWAGLEIGLGARGAGESRGLRSRPLLQPWGLLPPRPLPETPTFSLGTSSRCSVTERLLRNPLGPRSSESGCPPRTANHLVISRSCHSRRGGGWSAWVGSKVVWARAGNSRGRQALGSGSRRGVGVGGTDIRRVGGCLGVGGGHKSLRAKLRSPGS